MWIIQLQIFFIQEIRSRSTGADILKKHFIHPQQTDAKSISNQSHSKYSSWTLLTAPSMKAYNLLHVMPLSAGSWACMVTRSVTSRTIMLPSDRQTATMDPRTGFHFRSCTKVPGVTAGCRDAKGSFCCLPCSGKIKEKMVNGDEIKAWISIIRLGCIIFTLMAC